MRDLNRIQQDQQYWLSRGQLTALAVTTLSVAVLGFFVGLMVGRRTPPEPWPEVTAALVEPEVEQDALMDLLSRVEKAAARQVPTSEQAPLSYPEKLVAEDVVVPTTEPSAGEPSGSESLGATGPDSATLPEPEPVEVAQSVEAPPEPPPPEHEPAEGAEAYTPPSQGWSVQVAAYTSAGEADQRVAGLRAQDLDAWRAEALVRGRTWYRVRIGGHDTREDAQEAARELAVVLGTEDLLVARIER